MQLKTEDQNTKGFEAPTLKEQETLVNRPVTTKISCNLAVQLH